MSPKTRWKSSLLQVATVWWLTKALGRTGLRPGPLRSPVPNSFWEARPGDCIRGDGVPSAYRIADQREWTRTFPDCGPRAWNACSEGHPYEHHDAPKASGWAAARRVGLAAQEDQRLSLTREWVRQ